VSEAPQLLAPRLYRTDIDILNSLQIEWLREEFEELRRDFESDWNRAHFRWEDDALELVLRISEPLGDRRVLRLPALQRSPQESDGQDAGVDL